MFKWFRRNQKYQFISALKGEGTEILSNPERGWYLIEKFKIEDGQPGIKDLQPVTYMLTLIEINISAYKDGAISQDGLEQISSIFTALRKSGHRGIIRFLYDWDGECWKNEPTELDVVLNHMDQLSPILKKNADIIFTLQGVFIGNWGEMHGSRHLVHKELRQLIQKLADVTDPGTFLSVRTPAFWRIASFAYEPVPDTPLKKRIGLFDDALLSSENDMGTFAPVAGSAPAFSGLNDPESEKKFVSLLCRYVPNGGETAAFHQLNEGNEFIASMPFIHLTYLNAAYFPLVIENWKGTLCKEKGVFFGKPSWNYIEAYLGYRLLAEKIELKKDCLVLNLKNIGSAACCFSHKIKWVFVHPGSADVVTDAGYDLKDLQSGESAVLSVPVSNLKNEEYQVYLQIDGAIKIANEGAFNFEKQANLLGTLLILGPESSTR